ncbi:MAG TPA: hypothetical protein VNJ12_00785 [Candidatus Dormibacteraeota bacterium]|nr:hypothetical protein [Candidatus Dormibacteraeota bacterium]
MQIWVQIFVVIAAVALVLQTAILVALYLIFNRISVDITRISTSVESQLTPLLNRVRLLIEESQSDLHDIVHDTAEVARTVRANSRRFDRLLEEAADRLRGQIVHADRLVTGAMDTVEDSVKELQNSLVEPVRTVTAFVRGVKAGVNFFRGRSHVPERRREAEDEGLFV